MVAGVLGRVRTRPAARARKRGCGRRIVHEGDRRASQDAETDVALLWKLVLKEVVQKHSGEAGVIRVGSGSPFGENVVQVRKKIGWQVNVAIVLFQVVPVFGTCCRGGHLVDHPVGDATNSLLPPPTTMSHYRGGHVLGFHVDASEIVHDATGTTDVRSFAGVANEVSLVTPFAVGWWEGVVGGRASDERRRRCMLEMNVECGDRGVHCLGLYMQRLEEVVGLQNAPNGLEGYDGVDVVHGVHRFGSRDGRSLSEATPQAHATGGVVWYLIPRLVSRTR